MMYKHWKKIVLAVTAFFWNACDNSTSPTASQITPDSSSGTNVEPVSSSVAQPVSSAAEESRSSSAANATSSAANTPVSSATAKSSSSAAVEKNSSSSVTGKTSSSSVRAKSSSSSVKAKSSSSSVKERISSSSLDQNADLYGCPPDVCGAELSSSSGMMIAPKYGVLMSSSSNGMIAPKYGVPIMSSSSQGFEAVPLYGVVSNVCVKSENDSTLSCNGNVTCVESVTEEMQAPSCSGDQICAKYGVVIIRDKTYKCDDGKVYNEAEFKARYDILTVVENVKKKVPCYRRGDSVECDDGEMFSIDTDDKGNKVFVNEAAKLSEKEFLKKYEVLEMAPALYGPPCMFNGTCDEEK